VKFLKTAFKLFPNTLKQSSWTCLWSFGMNGKV